MGGLLRSDKRNYKRLKGFVGERGFEPPTPCAQGSEQKSILLARLAFLCVTVYGFRQCLSAFGPKLDPSFRHQLRYGLWLLKNSLADGVQFSGFPVAGRSSLAVIIVRDPR